MRDPCQEQMNRLGRTLARRNGPRKRASLVWRYERNTPSPRWAAFRFDPPTNNAPALEKITRIKRVFHLFVGLRMMRGEGETGASVRRTNGDSHCRPTIVWFGSGRAPHLTHRCSSRLVSWRTASCGPFEDALRRARSHLSTSARRRRRSLESEAGSAWRNSAGGLCL